MGAAEFPFLRQTEDYRIPASTQPESQPPQKRQRMETGESSAPGT
jgi:hypothetical protein